eukprot:1157657-Pelagomonas_calceolata.AAC.2
MSASPLGPGNSFGRLINNRGLNWAVQAFLGEPGKQIFRAKGSTAGTGKLPGTPPSGVAKGRG